MTEKDAGLPMASELIDGLFSRRALLKRGAMLGLALPIMGSLLAACGDDDDDDVAAPAQPDTTPAPADDDDDEDDEDVETPEPDDEEDDDEPTDAPTGGSVVWALSSDPAYMIPFGAAPTANMHGKEHMYDSLLAWDPDLNVEPALATSYEVNDDATEYVFELREGVEFHDGRTMSAEDVIYSLETAPDPPEPGTQLGALTELREATFEAADDMTVQVNFPGPNPGFAGLLAWTRHTPIVPNGLLDEIDVRTQGIGTGPFRLVEFVSNDRVVYERFENHWKDGVPRIDSLTLVVLPDEQARVAAVRSGEIDGGTFTAESVQVLERDDNLEVLRGLFAAPRVIQFTITGDEPWADVRVRQAINYACDRQQIIENVYSGDAEVSAAIPPGYGDWFLPPEELLERWYTPDLDRARELMDEAGYADGFDVELQSIAAPREYTQIAEIIQSQMAQININVSVLPLEIGQFAANNSAGEFEWHSTGRGMRGDPSQFVVDFPDGNHPAWFPGWNNEELDQAYSDALATADVEERRELYRLIQEIIAEEVPNMYTVQPYRYHVVRRRLQGMYVAYTEFHTGLREATVED